MNKVIEKIEDICNNITVCCVCNEKITYIVKMIYYAQEEKDDKDIWKRRCSKCESLKKTLDNKGLNMNIFKI